MPLPTLGTGQIRHFSRSIDQNGLRQNSPRNGSLKQVASKTVIGYTIFGFIIDSKRSRW